MQNLEHKCGVENTWYFQIQYNLLGRPGSADTAPDQEFSPYKLSAKEFFRTRDTTGSQWEVFCPLGEIENDIILW